MVKYRSTSSNFQGKSFKEVVYEGFAPDGTLYLPETLPLFSQEELLSLKRKNFAQCADFLLSKILSKDISKEILTEIAHEAFNFPLPLFLLDHKNKFYLLELFHGPTLSFKDIGARFMAAVLGKWQEKAEKPITILVATSGDTGSAVGRAFKDKPGCRTVVLFPKGKVTLLQREQLIRIGGNSIALEVEGTFDDCQGLLKEAMMDADLRKKLPLSVGNSINVARILPQSLYYFYAVAQIEEKEPVVSVPSGNFGHLVSGLLAKKMGLQTGVFIGATNINDEVPLFLKSGEFHPKPTLQTIACSMDVGNPSNFYRLFALYGEDLERLRKDLIGTSYNDAEIRMGIKEGYSKYGYIFDPHTAISFEALRDYAQSFRPHAGLILATAHPAKFRESVEPVIGKKLDIPPALALSEQENYISLKPSYTDFKGFLLGLGV